MKKFTKQQLQEYANKLHFNLSEQELNSLDSEICNVLTSLEKIKDFDLKDVKPLNYPHDQVFCNLRQDEPFQSSGNQNHLANVNKVKEGFVVIEYDK